MYIVKGFACQGNEFSHHMLLMSYFILNRFEGYPHISTNMQQTSSLVLRRTERIHEHTIYPYIHSFSNMSTASALLRPITIPDVLPSDLPEGSDFSLVAGLSSPNSPSNIILILCILFVAVSLWKCSADGVFR